MPDAVLAALAVEHGGEVVSFDRDLARFPDLRPRGVGEPALVAAVNSGGGFAASRTRRLVGLGSGANAHRALFM